MKIFISWSGERSEALAEALRNWFPLVLHFVEPWLSKSDIQAGERWSIEIAKELEGCNFGVICITRENLNSPWILFEAGALAKSMQDGRVIPLLLDLDFKEISGPLSQFQAKKFDATGIKELVTSLNKAAPTSVPEGQLEKLFSALWTDLEKQISSIPTGITPAKYARPEGEILEELVSSVRTVEARIRDAMDDDPSKRRRRRSRIDLDHIYMVMHEVPEGPRDPVILLLIAGLLREEAPWFYELAIDAYRAITTGRKQEVTKAVRRFSNALEVVQRGSFLTEIGLDRMTIKMIASEFLHSLEFLDMDWPDESAVGTGTGNIRRPSEKI